MAENLIKAIEKRRILFCDGGMGTQLQLQGLPPGACGEVWNVERPEAVMAVQSRYRDAGSDMVLTNTFQGSRIALARHGHADRAVELNEAAARLARRVMGPDRWVIGDIGPFGGMLEPLGDGDPDEVYAAFLEQARALIAGGVDAILIETMTAIEELGLGIRAAREAGATIVIGSMAFDKTSGGARTMMGVTPQQAGEFMDQSGADILGCNCGTNLAVEDYAAIVRAIRRTTQRPIIAQPNAGQPEMTPSGIVYRETPEKMASRIGQLVDAGASIVGGCCGTTPRHIELFKKALAGR